MKHENEDQSRLETMRDMAQAAAVAASVPGGDADAGAFSAQGYAAANIGDLKELVGEDPKYIPKAEDEKLGQAPAAGAQPSEKPAPVQAAQPQVWFDRDTKVSTALAAHKKWYTNVVDQFRSLLANMEQAAATAEEDPETLKEVQHEHILIRNRITAVKLVLGGHRRGAASPVTPPPVLKASVCAGLTGEKTKEIPGQIPNGEEKKDGVGLEEGGSPGKDAVAADDDKASSAAGFFRNAAESHPKALRKYIAGISDKAASEHAFGQSPPCRLYMNLICLEEFDVIPARLEKCISKEQITLVQQDSKLHKLLFS